MALDTVSTMQVAVNFNWNVAKNLTGFSPVSNNSSPTHRISFTKGHVADQLNELVAIVVTVPPGPGGIALDLSAALENVVNDVNVTLAKVKFLFVKLLSAADQDPAGTALGNACSGITVGENSDEMAYLTEPTAGIPLGNGDMFMITRRAGDGIHVGGSHNDKLTFWNEDPAVDAKVMVILGGADQ